MEKETFSSQNVSETLQLGKDYLEVKDKNGFSFYYVNPKSKYFKRDGIVEIQARKRSNRHGNVKQFRCITDRSNTELRGLIWGIPLGVDQQTGDIKWKAFQIEDKMTFDLSIPSQAEAWGIIKNSPFIEGSPNQFGKSVYEVIDKEKIAAKSLSTRDLRRKSEDIIYGLTSEQLMEAALNIGVNVQANWKTDMLKDEVCRKADENPKGFLEMWNNPNRQYTSIFNKAKSMAIITHNAQTFEFYYGNLPLGSTEELAVKFLSDNTNISAAISTKCNALEDQTRKNMLNRVQGKPEPIKQAVYEANKEESLEELEARIAILKAKKESKKEVVFNPEETGFATADDDLKAYREKAKKLGIKGAHLMAQDKLIEKIAEAESVSEDNEQ